METKSSAECVDGVAYAECFRTSKKAYGIWSYLSVFMKGHINICVSCIYLSHMDMVIYVKLKAKVNHKYIYSMYYFLTVLVPMYTECVCVCICVYIYSVWSNGSYSEFHLFTWLKMILWLIPWGFTSTGATKYFVIKQINRFLHYYTDTEIQVQWRKYLFYCCVHVTHVILCIIYVNICAH